VGERVWSSAQCAIGNWHSALLKLGLSRMEQVRKCCDVYTRACVFNEDKRNPRKAAPPATVSGETSVAYFYTPHSSFAFGMGNSAQWTFTNERGEAP